MTCLHSIYYRFLVIFPAIAQSMVNHAGIPISAVTVSNPSPGNAVLSLKASIKLSTPLTVLIDPVPLNLFIDDGTGNVITYTNIVLPETKIHGNTTIAFEDQPIHISNKTLWTQFVRSAVFQDKFMLSVAGSTNAFVGKLKAHINLKKDIPLTG